MTLTLVVYFGLGLTTEQIKKTLKQEESGPENYAFCPELLDTYKEKLHQILKKINAMETEPARISTRMSDRQSLISRIVDDTNQKHYDKK